jgi:fluoride exporter
VNIAGSFIIGFFATLTGPDDRIFADTLTRQFVMIGFLGGYTTFSSFSLQTLALLQDGEWLLASANIALSVIACLLAVLGRLCSRRFHQRSEVDLTMALSRDAVLLRTFIGEDDKADHRPL